MRSPSTPAGWLLQKEWRELMHARAWWVMLAVTGPLVGVTFSHSVNNFAEVSAGAGAGCGAVCDPLVGVWSPTFGAYEIASLFLLPFVAIRVMSSDRQSGALKLELQRAVSPLTRVGVKVAVLLAGWTISLSAAAIAMGLWLGYGGTIYAPEIAIVIAGHALNAGLSVALALAIASITEHPATAAIVTLAITTATWVVAFAAAIHGGLWEWLAGMTPAALVEAFQHGLVDVRLVLTGLLLMAGGIGTAAIWMRIGVPVRQRVMQTAVLTASTALLVTGASFVRATWDGSESRQNSFEEPDQEALEQIGRGDTPLSIEAHLAARDPRRLELERRAFAKLRRALPSTRITYVARTSTGLYEEADPGYGEIRYTFGDRRAVSPIVTEEGVLETIFALAQVQPPVDADQGYRGRPLVASPVGAALTFYGLWPLAVMTTGFFVARRHA